MADSVSNIQAPSGQPFIDHAVDVCVVGGGMAGVSAALAAARHGAKVVLMQDRPVLGGNSSGETRIHVCGADRHNSIKHMRETGILEELRLENLRRNPQRSYSLWELVLYEKVHCQPNITLLLNCSCLAAEMDGPSVRRVTGWQLTTQSYHRVSAAVFIDCSGDGILAPLTGAPARRGREGRDEFGESIAPAAADERTMGMTCLFHARRHATGQPFEPPLWAHRYDRCEDLPYGRGGHQWIEMGYWWIELGGEYDSIADTEVLRDELLKITLGVWDHIKNRCPDRARADCWALDWLGYLPAKRESRRYVGEHVLCQKDLESGGKFEDVVAYGGWSMDDHHPAGFRAAGRGEPATVFHPCPSPYGIPYRALYSRAIDNLMFAGRCASCTHAAMSSTRVMGTGASMGQAAGTAAAMAAARGVRPLAIGACIRDLQQTLLRDDAYLPWVRQELSAAVMGARLTTSQGDGEGVRDGINRQVGEDLHCWTSRPGDWIAYEFAACAVSETTLILDSDLARDPQMTHHHPSVEYLSMPPVLPRRFRLEMKVEGQWHPLAAVSDNADRLVRIAVARTVEGLRYTLDETWGQAPGGSRLYAFYFDCLRH
ncbi:MAG: FAD-dependent oxidoreductase [Planctomycetaceae bacterium]|nr:FAD-dependent oxidoreductase [Planctomycetaceae bacterium]